MLTRARTIYRDYPSRFWVLVGAGFITEYALFVVAILIITTGEMVVMPVGQAVVATLAPEDMRGRYIAAYDLAWSIPSTVGPGAAGVIMDNYDPRLVWYAGGVICAVAVAGFLLLHRAARGRLAARPAEGAA